MGLPNGDDDPSYVTAIAGMFNSDTFAYESYFDNNDDGIAPLGSSIPKATGAYEGNQVTFPRRSQVGSTGKREQACSTKA